ncbi:MAG: thioredoxin-disulfide reductase [Nitrospinaceae bacterium]|nr:thioredoxin-disulfide reductase [Nitrospinaceae bacterium]NIR55327.1 thioredoxin-disulfide reductase [Nitrospinaceae bacterium]NIS85766.1 thioredoxin-disulfide reductase [Nitrospinaceae bacterium]NIT82616.1 thioredoxin-disulfide reductase [Nitrospinaceae bacterium]NIU44821.1 thioredoxin-disulfide reductase [Nitrospinaceae bacterium]
MTDEVKKLAIIGSGPAGHTAAIYAARANLNPFMYEGYVVGGSAGGQLTTTTDVENYPGFPEGVSGPELMQLFRSQAARFGTEMVGEDVHEVDFSQRPFRIKGDETEVQAHAVIIATGATAKRMHVPSEEKLWNQGMSACAVCDGALPFFRNQPLMVIGGGDTAVEEATYLTKFGSVVYLVHRRDELRASKIMAKRALENEKIDILWDTVLEDAIGDQFVTGARIKNVKSSEVKELDVAGIFYAIGHTPNTQPFKGQLDMNETGYLIVQPGTQQTNVEGVFAAGDVHDHKYRQAVTAAGAGCAAALEAERWLGEQGIA